MDALTGHDAVVIGSGAGGAAAAWRMAEKGLNVLLLEAGPRFDPAIDYPLTNPDWERHDFPTKPGSRAEILFGDLGPIPHDTEVPRSFNAVWGALSYGDRRQVGGRGIHHVQGIGGTTLRYVGEAHRFHPDTFALRRLTGHGVDWPFGLEELAPYYALCEHLIGVAGADPHLPLPPHPLSPGAARLGRAATMLGLGWQANTRAALGAPYDDRPACNYCANCSRGCPLGDKGSADVTFLRHAAGTGRLTVRADTPVVRLIPAAGRRIAAVEALVQGRLRRIETPILMLCAGAVQTPRLLLASASTDYPEGVANGSGQVGRNFMETLSWSAAGLAPGLRNSHMGLPADAVCNDFLAPLSRADGTGGFKLSHATQEIGLVGPISYGTRLITGFGSVFQSDLRDAFGSALAVGAVGEVVPDDRSRITLSQDQNDAMGVALPVVSSVLTGDSLKRLSAMAQEGRTLLRAAGVTTILEETSVADRFSSTHLAGTCRMSSDAQTGVVDPHCRSHEIDNLFIADASVFPSSGGGAAPSLTIHALAVRAADAAMA
ncbi:GMC oxidoreductase [Lutimaribacter marinistellae]|uniref:GMC oxidoreductase n=1 Tax=Lutimaribacter marinistellae TaxID=1820329 RepID=A0ABV7TJJ6_9RHOB